MHDSMCPAWPDQRCESYITEQNQERRVVAAGLEHGTLVQPCIVNAIMPAIMIWMENGWIAWIVSTGTHGLPCSGTSGRALHGCLNTRAFRLCTSTHGWMWRMYPGCKLDHASPEHSIALLPCCPGRCLFLPQPGCNSQGQIHQILPTDRTVRDPGSMPNPPSRLLACANPL